MKSDQMKILEQYIEQIRQEAFKKGQETRQAYWERQEKYGGVICSNCGNYERHPTKYCSHCGCMMGHRVKMEDIT